ncbi:hypothetical protein [Pararhodonellum marinum]|uniref:hypothetical protein n=1 Tax=Pararhodonellum marinum TaxID=2755358 RepID=UPI00188FA78C|nr:hypothetical protein [Pararhodonellum marinum]
MIDTKAGLGEAEKSSHFAKKHEQIELIKGEFASEDARDLLLQLFGDKIKYHQINILSSMERFGKANEVSAKRLPELRLQVQKINELFQNADFSGAKIKLQATVHIEITD